MKLREIKLFIIIQLIKDRPNIEFWYARSWVSPAAQMIKNLPAMQETQVWSTGLGRSPGGGMATHSSLLAWGIPWTEEHRESDTTERLTLPHTFLLTSDSLDIILILGGEKKGNWQSHQKSIYKVTWVGFSLKFHP